MPLDRSIGNYFDSTAAHLVRVARWSGPTSYVTGGEDVSPAVFGVGKLIALAAIAVVTDGTNTRLVAWNTVTQKLMWFVPNTNAEVANGTNLSTFIGSLVVFGN